MSYPIDIDVDWNTQDDTGLADRVQLQVAYAIGTAHPVSMTAQTFARSDFG